MWKRTLRTKIFSGETCQFKNLKLTVIICVNLKNKINRIGFSYINIKIWEIFFN